MSSRGSLRSQWLEVVPRPSGTLGTSPPRLLEQGLEAGLKLVTRGKGAGDTSFLFIVLLSKNIRERTPWSGTANTQPALSTDGRLDQGEHLGFGVRDLGKPAVLLTKC